jgi:NADPH:quinone reductase-like Zn-dependent oxidoreductase
VAASLDAETLSRWLYAPAANQSIAGFNIGGWFMERPRDAAAALTDLIEGALSGALKLPRITALPLREARQAHLALEGRSTEGKLVIKPWA